MQTWGRAVVGPVAALAVSLAVAVTAGVVMTAQTTPAAATTSRFQGQLVVAPGGSVLLPGQTSFTNGKTIASFRIPQHGRSELRLAADARAQRGSGYRAVLGFRHGKPTLTLLRVRHGRVVVLDRARVRRYLGEEVRIELGTFGRKIRARASTPGRPAPAWQVGDRDRRALTRAGHPRAQVRLSSSATSAMPVDYGLASVVNGIRRTVPVPTTQPPSSTSPTATATDTPTASATPTTTGTATTTTTATTTDTTSAPPSTCPELGVYNHWNPDLDHDSIDQFGAFPQVANTYVQPTQRLNIARETARIRRGTSPNVTITSKGTSIIEALGDGPRHPGYASAYAWLSQYVDDLSTLADVDPSVPVYATFEHEFKVKMRRGDLTGRSADPVVYGRALNLFFDLVESTNPRLRTMYWMAGSDRVVEGLVGDQLTHLPEMIAFDPYGYAATDTLASITARDLEWIRAQSWYVGQDIALAEFGIRVAVGDEALSEFFTDVSQQLDELGLAWAVLFQSQDELDTRIAGRSDYRTFPGAQSAYGESLQQAITC